MMTLLPYPRRVCIFLALGVILLSLAPTLARADPNGSISSGSNEAMKLEEPAYCGVCALHRALVALGKQVPFDDLLKPEYIGSKKGSSDYELARAVMDCGLRCEGVRRMTCGMLQRLQSPTILRVRAKFESPDYNQWVLFMGTEDGKARIYEGSHAVQLVDFADLNARWDGAALILSDSAIDCSELYFESASSCILFGALSLLITATGRYLQRSCATRGISRPPSCKTAIKSSSYEMAAILAIASITAFACRACQSPGFLCCDRAITAIQEEKITTFLPRVKVQDVSHLRDRGVVLVDARLGADFNWGHLEGAISLPPSSSLERCREALAGTRAADRIIVYCRCEKCPYAATIARKLSRCGFTQIALLDGGWLAWDEYHAHSTGSGSL